MFFSVIIFILTLLVLILIHELGHFLMAKKFGIKVEEFGFGIPPRAWGKKIGETIYSLNWLPFGGFVRLLGEDETDKNVLANKRSFAAANVWKRIVVVICGVGMNFIFAILLFYIVLFARGFKFQVPLLLDHNFVGVEEKIDSKVFVAQVVKDSPADKAGIKTGEQIVAINNENILNDAQMVSKTKSLAGKEITLNLQDPQTENLRTIKLTPREKPPAGEGALGVALIQIRLASLEYKSPMQKVFSAPFHAWNITSYSLRVFGRLIGQSFAQKNLTAVSQSVAGPVGITTLANNILKSSDKPLIPYLDFVAMLSLNLAVMNLLPIPALDGGRLFFLMIEALTRKKVHVGVEKWIHSFGMAALLLLTLIITASDIKKLLP